MTRSALHKAAKLSEAGFKVTIVTFRHRIDQEEHIKSLRSSRRVHPSTEFINFYDDLEQKMNDLVSSEQLTTIRVPDADLLVQKANNRLTRFFNADGSLAFTELISDNTKIPHKWRRFYDEDLNLLRLEEITEAKNIFRVQRYYPGRTEPSSRSMISSLGCAYITSWYDAHGVEKTVIDHTVSEESKQSAYKSTQELQSSWFKDLIQRYTNPVVLLDDPYVFNVVKLGLELNPRNVLTVHNNTFTDPANELSEINAEHFSLLKNANLFSKIVVSTNQQAEDLRTVLKGREIQVIPQPVAPPPLNIKTKHSYQSLSFVGRLEPQKQILELVNHFPQVLDVYPEVTLNIYGQGSQREAIEETISDLQLENNVFMHGQAVNVEEIFASSYLTLFPSKFEGFGLSLAESMLMRTPVVSFNCKYGPCEMIDSGINGYLVPQGDFEAFNAQLIKCLENPDEVEELRGPARNKIKKLCDPETIATAWELLIKDVATSS